MGVSSGESTAYLKDRNGRRLRGTTNMKEKEVKEGQWKRRNGVMYVQRKKMKLIYQFLHDIFAVQYSTSCTELQITKETP